MERIRELITDIRFCKLHPTGKLRLKELLYLLREEGYKITMRQLRNITSRL